MEAIVKLRGVKSIQDTAIDTLVDLGLSLLQAKAYFALATSGIQTGRSLAKISKIAPQDIYRLLAELAEKGLVEKIISKPAQYRAIPLADGLKELLRRRQEETEKLTKEAEWISKAAEAFPVIDETGGEFRILPGKEPVDRMAQEIFLTAKVSVDLMNETQEVLNLHDRHLECKKSALKNGVQIREIIGKSSPDAHLPISLLNVAKTTRLLKIKMLDSPPNARLMIKDDKEVFFATTTLKSGTLSQPFLWTNNPVLVQIVVQWYNGIWAAANTCPE
jgi:sugar-specific transcriptional regulator TrmB